MSDINIDPVPDQPAGGTISTDTAQTIPPVENPPAKPRSGFARQKLKLARLSDLYQNLLVDHEQLLLRCEQLEADYGKLGQEYRALEEAFNEITTLNASLSAELRQAKQQHLGYHRQSPPFGGLMGMMR